MTAIECSGLGRSYGERVALQDLTLSLEEGRTLVVFGPNGAGKSTLLRVLATLLRPHAGTARVLGRELPGDGWAVRGRIGFVGHEPLLYRELTGRENLRHTARLFGVDGGRAEELLERVGMERRADEPVRTLSRGMAQRLAICRATLHDPELLLLDEPLAGLDPAAIELVSPLRPRPDALASSPATTRSGGCTTRTSRSGCAVGGRLPRPGGRRGRAGDPGAVPVRVTGALVRKELLLEWRTKESVPAMALFSLTTFVIFHFALDRYSLEGALAAGVLWATLLFAAMLGINRLFVAEHEQGGFEALPARSGRPYDAAVRRKASSLFCFLAAVEVVALPAFAVLLLGPRRARPAPSCSACSCWPTSASPPWAAGLRAGRSETRARDLIAPLAAAAAARPRGHRGARRRRAAASGGRCSAAHLGRWLAVLTLYDLVFVLLAFARLRLPPGGLTALVYGRACARSPSPPPRR